MPPSVDGVAGRRCSEGRCSEGRYRVSARQEKMRTQGPLNGQVRPLGLNFIHG